MDPSRFDHLTRLLGGASGRRELVRALLGVALGVPAVEAATKKRDSRGKGRGRGNGKAAGADHDQGAGQGQSQDQAPQGEGQVEATPDAGLGQDLHAERHGGKRTKRNKHKKKHGGSGGGGAEACCGSKSCAAPKAGAIRDGCGYAGESFAGADLRGAQFERIDGRQARFTGADLRGAHFTAACLQNAAFRRAKLDGALFGQACLFGADFTGAALAEPSAAFSGGLFCGTLMLDGTTNDRDCGNETACCRRSAEPGADCQRDGDCPAEACQTAACTDGQCVYGIVADGPDPGGACGNGSSGHCCEGACCLPGATECNPSGLCCAPNCAGRECGPDGCGSGGTCGTCDSGTVCDDDSGQCLCIRKSCPDGCCSDGPGNPGTCQSGTTVQACGTGGAACAACAAGDGCLDQQCASCTPACLPGLRCNGNGQCVCDEQSCPTGCCFSNSGGSICLDGKVGAFCGSGGESCVDCGQGAQCFGQVCICRPGQCSGCCEHGPNNPGRCLPNTPPVCGIGGNQCTSCPADNACNGSGQCVCTAESCASGCCANGPGNAGACRAGNTDQNCGAGGASCVACAAGNACVGGRCVCNKTSCPNGCCTNGPGNPGACRSGDAFQACGTGGEACASCDSQQTCQDGQCVNCGNFCTCTGQSICTDPGGSNLECSGPTDPNACFCYVSQTGRPICGGSVSILEPNGCGSDADCGPGGACVANTGDSGPCGANGKPFCVGPCCQPNCVGKQCGPDGCGGNCGTCPGQLQCESGRCVSPCTPQTCPTGCCAADGSCQPGTSSQACGTAGVACAACGAGEGCLAQHCVACTKTSCQALGAVCGPHPDNCGGMLQCGACPLNGGAPSCQNGKCLACDAVCSDLCAVCIQVPGGATECVGNAVTFCQEAPPCTSDAECGGQFPRCVVSTVDRATGDTFFLPDVCQKAGAVGICVAVAACCQPDCTGKQCGDDGCGGSCGTCGQCQACQNGACQATGNVCGDTCCGSDQFCCTDAGAYCCNSCCYQGCCGGECCE